MNLYLISQAVNSDLGTFHSAVVCAASYSEARKMHPNGVKDWEKHTKNIDVWATPEYVKVKMLGQSNTNYPRVICASFNAG